MALLKEYQLMKKTRKLFLLFVIKQEKNHKKIRMKVMVGLVLLNLKMLNHQPKRIEEDESELWIYIYIKYE